MIQVSSPGLLQKFVTQFTGLEVQGMGSAPLVLNPQLPFYPIGSTIVLSGTTVPFDFGPTAYPGILMFSASKAWIEGTTVLQNLIDDIPSFGAPGSTYTFTADVFSGFNKRWAFTTSDGSDATVGDSIVTVTLWGYYL